MISPKRMMMELAIKNGLTIFVFSVFYTPLTIEPMQSMPAEVQESVISLMGFLMAAAIIGAFELSYSKTNLSHRTQRLLAHFTKFTLYTAIMLLMQIAITAMAVTKGDFIWVLVMATTPVALSLFLYDFWDALRALDNQSAP